YDDEVTIYPTIIQPVIMIALTGSAYYGLLVDSIIRGDSYESRKNTMLMQFKVLSDNSKFTILRSIKEEPKYSTQLVEELHLSASTISHHMSALVNANLVSIEKMKGKVYFKIKEESFMELEKGLRELFL
ncbi:MAG: ArsR family transcriptional regulator, partial [Streptococcaceae bacterium]|nr:ArsR family transcriptional regulator [Streptococcaceae bacterium]